MYFAMCADLSMLLGILFFIAIVGLVVIALITAVIMAVSHWIGSWRNGSDRDSSSEAPEGSVLGL